MKSYLPLIIGMMLVTYLPRLIPLLLMTEKPLNPKIKKFLLYIPYTALSALIVRGVLEASPEMKIATLVGIAAAGICSWIKEGLVLSVFISIMVVFMFLKI